MCLCVYEKERQINRERECVIERDKLSHRKNNKEGRNEKKRKKNGLRGNKKKER